jgi:uncharacterized protein (TIGR02145 family)
VKVITTSACAAPSGSATRAITVYALPTITLASGSTAQTVTAGSAITQIKYTTANATGATPSNLPTGVSGAWASNTYTVSGTPTSVGTYNYTVTTTNSNGCSNATATGRITVQLSTKGCTTASLNLGTAGFTSSTTYSRNGLTISSPVTATNCNNKTYSSFDGGSSGNYKADCANNNYDASYGNWFSWCTVVQYASKLCPSPWRVPTNEDHCLIANNSSTDCSNKIGYDLGGVDGYAKTGYVRAGTAVGASVRGYYWSSTSTSDSNAVYFSFNSGGTYPSLAIEKDVGFALRCVR